MTTLKNGGGGRWKAYVHWDILAQSKEQAALPLLVSGQDFQGLDASDLTLALDQLPQLYSFLGPQEVIDKIQILTRLARPK